MNCEPVSANLQHEQCNCHECTQARWKMSFQYQISSALVTTIKYEPKPDEPTQDDMESSPDKERGK